MYNKTLKRLKTISFFGSSVEDYHCPDQEIGEYITDDSHFVPESEVVKQLKGQSVLSPDAKRMYDYQDGKDTGQPIPVDRTHGYTGDVAELSVAMRLQKEDVETALKRSKREFEQSEFAKKVDADTASSTSSTSATTSSNT